MKKIININLSGRVIPIEDSAYEKLQGYIESLRRYFAHEDGRDEIINDIESRIAELMNEKIRKGATCVTDADIEEIIASMGRPEDFDAEAAEATTDSSQKQTGSDYSYTKSAGRGRLYRDGSDKFIGGVCSGIANYLNTDPAIVRILFAIITFGGFGLGFLIYILLWIILPVKNMEGYAGKRLFRNPDDKIIGGVAGGLAAYFNTKTSNLRLIFAAPLLLSILLSILDSFSWNNDFDFFPNIVFGSLSGTFFLAYLVLWIVLPEARTPYDKMEMRGEKVDVNTIRQNVQEGMGNVKDRVKTWSEEVKQSATNLGNKAREFSSTRGREFASDLKETARSGGRGIGHAIGVIFKAFFLFIAGTIAFALFVALIALVFAGVAWWPINDFLWTSKWQLTFAWGTVIFFLFVPLVAFIIWVIRRVMGVRSRSSYMGWTFAFLWTLGWVSVILLVASLTQDFRKDGTDRKEIAISNPVNDRMIIAVSEPALQYSGRFDWVNDDGEGWDLSNDTLKLSTIKLTIHPSRDSAYHVFVVKHGYGRSVEDATARASRIQYSVYSRDSIIDLGSGYAIDKDSKFRAQHVEVQVWVPINRKLRFDESIRQKLNLVNFKVRRSYRNDRIVYFDADGDFYTYNFRTDIDYVMGVDGVLQDPSGKKLERNGNGYRYEDNSGSGADTTESIEERERRWQEEGRRIKEDKEKQKKQSGNGQTGFVESRQTRIANIPTPGFSLVKSFF